MGRNEKMIAEKIRFLIKKVLAVIVTMSAIYFIFASAINYYFYDFSQFSFWTELKYISSLMADVISRNFQLEYDIDFEVPKEYREYIFEHGFHGHEISIYDYHYLLDFLPNAAVYQFYILYLFLSFCVGIFVYAKSEKPTNEKIIKREKYIRGAKKVTAKELCVASAKTKDAGIVLPTKDGKLALDKQKEKEHMIILGSTGTGKSTLLLSIVSRLIARKTKIIFVDRKGEFWGKFGRNNKDILFNPFDSRSVKWSIFNEINFELNSSKEIEKIPPDLQVTADILFGVNHPQRQKNRYWYVSGSSVFCSTICYLAINGKTSNKDITDFFASPADKIIAAFKTLPEGCRIGLAALGEKATSEQVGQIMSMVADCSKQLACFTGLDGDFSARKWICEQNSTNLYLSTAGKNDTNFNTIITLLLDLVGREIKEFPDNGGQDTRIVFVIDELAALPPLESLKFLLTQARSKGVAVIVANQTVARLKAIYGIEETRNIIACAKTRFFFQTPEADDAKYLAQTLGQYQAERKIKSQNESSGTLLAGIGTSRKGKTENNQIVKDDAFMAADIASLQTGQAIVMIPNLLPMVAMVQLKKEDIPQKNQEYEPLKTIEIGAKEYSQIHTQPVQIPEQEEETMSIDDEPEVEVEKDYSKIVF